jgi:tartrate dehydratase alpha subunit/fumarate hydratase class I-like protein
LQNAAVAIEGRCSCQDTGTAIVMAKGENVYTESMMLNGFQEDFYQERNLRYSQIVP